jgi:osmotically inducible lipoprotein OsmB
MKTLNVLAAAGLFVVLSGCSGMTEQQRGTATGAVIGGMAGNILGGGGGLETAAGAVAGGVVGHEVTKPK